MLKEIFPDENAKKAGVKIGSVNTSCPNDTYAYQMGLFAVEANSPKLGTRFFDPLNVQIREVLTFGEVAKKL
ncbi:MAG TPA: hypothetical protein VK253_06810 [Candidatus Binatia bacterium]|nr:hypothetical protein [Candidatus Binatia bacterium]